MHFRHLLLSCCVLPFIACTGTEENAAGFGYPFADPMIGSGYHGHVFVGANVPFGMVQLGPTQVTQGWDWCSGYHYSDSLLIGFGHTHLSGTGIGDLGDISLFPLTAPDQRSAFFRHADESVRPGYYQVTLSHGVQVELTATERAGFHRYTFPAEATEAYLLLDIRQGIGWDAFQSGDIDLTDTQLITGSRLSKGWAEAQRIYFAATFSQPVLEAKLLDPTHALLTFEKTAGKALQVLAKVGISPVAVAGAQANLAAEIPDWDFAGTLAAAEGAWRKQFDKIRIATADTSILRNFYTAMYHSMIAPSLFSDVDGQYRGADGQIYPGESGQVYTTFSLWDTYRAAHPLATLIHPELLPHYGRTFMNIFRQQGKLPVWHLVGNETNCMVGNPGIPVLADLVAKGYVADKEAAYQAMRASAMLDERDMNLLKQYGYIPYDKDPNYQSISECLEYALADWCVAQTAQALGKEEDARYFGERAKAYAHYFDPSIGFFRGKDSQGRFRPDFSPFYSNHTQGDFTEGNAWQYTFLVPHDIPGLIALFGSEEAFENKLDSLFVAQGYMGAEASNDISGLIGQYAHGNEPSHHIIYMYNYIGKPYKAAARLRQVLYELYQDTPEGLCGNEDVGQMSAWYILSSLGLYQVAPACGVYVLGSPIVDEAVLQVGEGKTFTIKALQNSKENMYIQAARLNGQPYTRSYLSYQDIVAGGILELEMGPRPSAFGTAPEDRP